jgi:uncharacterized cysteine cluster protein YcgN (CxxCxxCC family)
MGDTRYGRTSAYALPLKGFQQRPIHPEDGNCNVYRNTGKLVNIRRGLSLIAEVMRGLNWLRLCCAYVKTVF